MDDEPYSAFGGAVCARGQVAGWEAAGVSGELLQRGAGGCAVGGSGWEPAGWEELAGRRVDRRAVSGAGRWAAGDAGDCRVCRGGFQRWRPQRPDASKRGDPADGADGWGGQKDFECGLQAGAVPEVYGRPQPHLDAAHGRTCGLQQRGSDYGDDAQRDSVCRYGTGEGAGDAAGFESARSGFRWGGTAAGAERAEAAALRRTAAVGQAESGFTGRARAADRERAGRSGGERWCGRLGMRENRRPVHTTRCI